MKNKCSLRCSVFRLRDLFCSALVCAAAISVQANTITVTNTNDSGPGSLRQALVDAHDGDAINFVVTGTIQLTTDELSIDKSVTISGPGANSLTVSGSYQQFIGFSMSRPAILSQSNV